MVLFQSISQPEPTKKMTMDEPTLVSPSVSGSQADRFGNLLCLYALRLYR